jgi:t-SNARE complex subunit (syntaxin)
MRAMKVSPQETTSLLIDSVQTAQKTEEIGINTMRNMQYQRELLTDTRKNLYETKDVMSNAKASIREIENKAFRQKLWLWVIIFVLFCANVAVIVALVRNGGKFYHTGA